MASGDDGGKLADPTQLLATINGTLQSCNTLAGQHISGQIAKFVAQLRIRVRLVKIACCPSPQRVGGGHPSA